MTSLEHRISRVLADAGPGWRVLRFTYWYTGRPPLHEARVIRG